jgi:hypothetical protein
MNKNLQIEKELKKIKRYSRMLKGNIYEVKKKCGKERCKCQNGNFHLAFQLTYKIENNITKTIYIKKDQVKKVMKYISNYKKAKISFDKVADLNIELLKS